MTTHTLQNELWKILSSDWMYIFLVLSLVNVHFFNSSHVNTVYLGTKYFKITAVPESSTSSLLSFLTNTMVRIYSWKKHKSNSLQTKIWNEHQKIRTADDERKITFYSIFCSAICMKRYGKTQKYFLPHHPNRISLSLSIKLAKINGQKQKVH